MPELENLNLEECNSVAMPTETTEETPTEKVKEETLKETDEALKKIEKREKAKKREKEFKKIMKKESKLPKTKSLKCPRCGVVTTFSLYSTDPVEYRCINCNSSKKF